MRDNTHLFNLMSKKLLGSFPVRLHVVVKSRWLIPFGQSRSSAHKLLFQQQRLVFYIINNSQTDKSLPPVLHR